MDIFLIFIIMLAVGCVLYSVLIFKNKLSVKITSDGWTLRRENDHLYFHYKNVPFSCCCDFDSIGDGSDRRFIIKTIHIELKAHPSSLAGWTKNDLYTIEERLIGRFPDSEIMWGTPMDTLINEEKVSPR